MGSALIGKAAQVIHDGGVIAYPTESCFGLGCDPKNYNAVKRLLKIKARSPEKGLILIAADPSQVLPYVTELSDEVLASWPGPVTWLVPPSHKTPNWIRGRHPRVAVRVTAHPVAATLCHAAGQAIVSTSANLHGQQATRTYRETCRRFGQYVDLIVPGRIGQRRRPSRIIDAVSKKIVRAG